MFMIIKKMMIQVHVFGDDNVCEILGVNVNGIGMLI